MSERKDWFGPVRLFTFKFPLGEIITTTQIIDFLEEIGMEEKCFNSFLTALRKSRNGKKHKQFKTMPIKLLSNDGEFLMVAYHTDRKMKVNNFTYIDFGHEQDQIFLGAIDPIYKAIYEGKKISEVRLKRRAYGEPLNKKKKTYRRKNKGKTNCCDNSRWTVYAKDRQTMNINRLADKLARKQLYDSGLNNPEDHLVRAARAEWYSFGYRKLEAKFGVNIFAKHKKGTKMIRFVEQLGLINDMYYVLVAQARKRGITVVS